MTGSYIPRRGDLIWLNFEPQAGHEQAGRRPAFVLSPEAYNRKTGLLLACPLTSKVKGYPFEVAVPAGLLVSGVILADQLKSLEWKVRQAQFISRTPASVIENVLSLVLALVGQEG